MDRIQMWFTAPSTNLKQHLWLLHKNTSAVFCKTNWLEKVSNFLYSIHFWQRHISTSSVLLLMPSVRSYSPQRVLPSYDPALASVCEPQTTNWADRIWQRQKRIYWECVYVRVCGRVMIVKPDCTFRFRCCSHWIVWLMKNMIIFEIHLLLLNMNLKQSKQMSSLFVGCAC